MRKYFCWLLLLMGAGCMVGPHYHMPETCLPDQFVETQGAEQISDEELCGWWKQFEDPLLNSLIDEAVKDNYDFLIALEQIVAARAQYQIQFSYLFPEIDANAAAIRERFSQNIFTGAANTEAFASGQSAAGTTAIGAANFSPINNFFQMGFDAVWELDAWGKFRRAKEAAKDQWQASEFLANGVLLSVIAEVARDYVSLRSLQQQIALQKKKIRADERELELIKALFEAGLDNEIDIQSQIATLEADRAQLPVLETSFKQMIYSLAVLLGKPPEDLAHRFDEIAPVPIFVGKVPAGLPSELLRRRPDIRAAERQLAAATEQIGIAIAGYYPHFFLTGNGIGYESSQMSNFLNKTSQYWSIGPTFNWNLIDWGRTRAQVSLAKAQEREAYYSYENTVITALQDVEGALVAYFEEEKRNRDLAGIVAADARSFTLTEDLFHAGLVSEIQEQESVKALLTAQISLVQSQQSLGSDLIALYKAMGGNWECTPTP